MCVCVYDRHEGGVLQYHCHEGGLLQYDRHEGGLLQYDRHEGGQLYIGYESVNMHAVQASNRSMIKDC